MFLLILSYFSMSCNIPLSYLFPRNSKNSVIQPSTHIPTQGRRFSPPASLRYKIVWLQCSSVFPAVKQQLTRFFSTHWKLTCSKVCYGVAGWMQGLKKAQRSGILELWVAVNLCTETSLLIFLCTRYQASCWEYTEWNLVPGPSEGRDTNELVFTYSVSL